MYFKVKKIYKKTLRFALVICASAYNWNLLLWRKAQNIFDITRDYLNREIRAQHTRLGCTMAAFSPVWVTVIAHYGIIPTTQHGSNICVRRLCVNHGQRLTNERFCFFINFWYKKNTPHTITEQCYAVLHSRSGGLTRTQIRRLPPLPSNHPVTFRCVCMGRGGGRKMKTQGYVMHWAKHA